MSIQSSHKNIITKPFIIRISISTQSWEWIGGGCCVHLHSIYISTTYSFVPNFTFNVTESPVVVRVIPRRDLCAEYSQKKPLIRMSICVCYILFLLHSSITHTTQRPNGKSANILTQRTAFKSAFLGVVHTSAPLERSYTYSPHNTHI